jgi:hypothetical protein
MTNTLLAAPIFTPTTTGQLTDVYVYQSGTTWTDVAPLLVGVDSYAVADALYAMSADHTSIYEANNPREQPGLDAGRRVTIARSTLWTGCGDLRRRHTHLVFAHGDSVQCKHPVLQRYMQSEQPWLPRRIQLNGLGSPRSSAVCRETRRLSGIKWAGTRGAQRIGPLFITRWPS